MGVGYLASSKGTIYFKAEFPSGISANKSAQWNTQEVIARHAPIFGYSSSGAMEVAFTIRFSVEEGPVMERVKILFSLVYPDYGSNVYMPPPVKLKLDNFIELEGHVSQVSVTVPDEIGWTEGEPSAVECQVTVVEDSLHLQTNLIS